MSKVDAYAWRGLLLLVLYGFLRASGAGLSMPRFFYA
jgi:hypothetical protein